MSSTVNVVNSKKASAQAAPQTIDSFTSVDASRKPGVNQSAVEEWKTKTSEPLKKEPPKSIYKVPGFIPSSENSVANQKKTFRFDSGSVARAQFKHYPRYFISNNSVEHLKENATMPGFYFYLGDNFDLSVLVVHAKDRQELICLSEVAKTEEDKEFVKKLAEEFRKIDADKIGEKEEISLIDESEKTDTSKLKTIHLILSNCKKIPCTSERKPFQIINLSSSDKLTQLLQEKFDRKSNVELSSLTESCTTSPDVYIAFYDMKTSKEMSQNLAGLANQSGSKVIWVLATHKKEFDQYALEIAKAIWEQYSDGNGNAAIEALKKTLSTHHREEIRFYDRTKNARHWEIIFSDLVKLYMAINARPKTISKYYEAYQNNLKKIDGEFQREKSLLFKRTFKRLDECEKEFSKLQGDVAKRKKDELEFLIEKIKNHYPSHYGWLSHDGINTEQYSFFYSAPVQMAEDAKENKINGPIIISPRNK